MTMGQKKQQNKTTTKRNLHVVSKKFKKKLHKKQFSLSCVKAKQ